MLAMGEPVACIAQTVDVTADVAIGAGLAEQYGEFAYFKAVRVRAGPGTTLAGRSTRASMFSSAPTSPT